MATTTFGQQPPNRQGTPGMNANLWNDAAMSMTGGAMGRAGDILPPPGGGGMTPGQTNLSQYVPQAPTWESNVTFGDSPSQMPSWMPSIEGAFHLESFRNKDDRKIWESMLSAAIPAAQLMQTGYQQSLDYNLASQAQNWAQQGDVFNMQMASQQQQMAEWQAQQMANQFQQQFGLDEWQAREAAQQFQQQLQQQNQQFGQQIGLDRDRLGLDRELGMGGLQLGRDQLTLDQLLGTGRLDLDRELGMGGLNLQRELGMGQLDIQREQNRIDEMFRAGQLSNEQYANETNRLAQQAQASFQQGQLGLGRDQLGLDTWRAQQEMQLATAAQRLNELVQTGTLSVAQANQALQELQNQQQFGLQQQQFGFQQQQWGQELDWRRESAAQQAQLERERMESQQQQAQMQAFGRQQTPQGRFVRNF